VGMGSGLVCDELLREESRAKSFWSRAGPVQGPPRRLLVRASQIPPHLRPLQAPAEHAQQLYGLPLREVCNTVVAESENIKSDLRPAFVRLPRFHFSALKNGNRCQPRGDERCTWRLIQRYFPSHRSENVCN